MKREVYFVERGSSPVVKTLWLIGKILQFSGAIMLLLGFVTTQAVNETSGPIPEWYSQLDNPNTLFVMFGTLVAGYMFIWVARFINWWSREFI